MNTARLQNSYVKAAVVAMVFAVLAGGADAVPIATGTYVLHNHPDGAKAPPLYGLPLDELYNATGGHDVFTFDFDHALSDMRLDYNSVAATVRIYGSTYGGRDTGAAHAADTYLGVYDVDFIYTVGVGLAGGDDDVIVITPTGSNSGTITPSAGVNGPSVGGGSVALGDQSDGSYNFRFGDRDDDNGHRGFPGLSGWGWLTIGGQHVASQDWLFTAELDPTTTIVPEPATFALLSMAGSVLLVRRRRHRRRLTDVRSS